MSKPAWGILVVLLLAAVALCCYLIFFRTSYQDIPFSPSDRQINNPSRGFYRQIATDKPEDLQELEKNERLVLAEYDLVDYKSRELSADKLQELADFCTEARKQGVKLIFRAGYGFSSDAELNDASELTRIEGHINRIAPILNQNKDILLGVQGGFLGPWGEWHSSLLLEDKPEAEQILVRNSVLSALLQALDPEVIINLRRPSFIRDAQKAGIDTNRVGFHNDGLLSTESDYGTYRELTRTEELEWCAQNIATGINGGEMPRISDWTTPQNAAAEFVQLKLGYLNAHYNKEVLAAWKTETLAGQNALSYIENRLGYRLRLEQLRLPKRLAVGADTMAVTLNVKNDGFAPIESGYAAKLLVYVNGAISDSYPLTDDLRTLTDGEVKPLTVRLTQQMRDNGFTIGLQLYDAAPTLADDARWCIELANEDLDYSGGVNSLLRVTVEDRDILCS